ncbi:MAG: hypothetical protein GX270_13875 [Clostridiaceae bacterium]|jgi:hypothetical protein|nr:hypothetical protein [Clostridiaceae bacterium]
MKSRLSLKKSVISDQKAWQNPQKYGKILSTKIIQNYQLERISYGNILSNNSKEEKTLKSNSCFMKEYSVGKHLKR